MQLRTARNPHGDYWRTEICVILMDMEKQEMIKELLNNKRKEIVWALALQGYTHEDITEILRPVDRSNITRLVNQMPENYQPKWVKRNV